MPAPATKDGEGGNGGETDNLWKTCGANQMSQKAYAIMGMIRQLTDADIRKMNTAGLNALVQLTDFICTQAQAEIARRYECERSTKAAQGRPIVQAYADRNGIPPDESSDLGGFRAV